MKMRITINLGNHENICIESSDQGSALGCVAELTATAMLFVDRRVPEFMTRLFGEQE